MTDRNPSASRPTVALLTDFGLNDIYAGTMKGVIRSIAPEAEIVDLTHGVPPHSILIGAVWLRQAAPYFPDGTIFLCVVDPGVGTERRALVASAGGRYFVAPDNGLLSFTLGEDARVHTIENRAYTLDSISATFHGRDVFAPVAAHLARGVSLESFGPPVPNPIRIPWPRPAPLRKGRWRLPVVAVDHFGNLITALRPDDLLPLGLSDIRIRIADHSIGAVSPTFGAVGQGQWLAYWGSGGLLEIGINGGNASATAGLGAGDTVLLEDPAQTHEMPAAGGASA